MGIAQAMLNDPKLLILDEPINGLDPIGIAEVRSFIRALCDERGKTILISSHITSDLEKVADYIAYLHQGKLLLCDEPTGALDSRTGQEVLQFLQQLNREGSTIILITHDNGIAATAERIVRLADGKIIADGTREEVGL